MGAGVLPSFPVLNCADMGHIWELQRSLLKGGALGGQAWPPYGCPQFSPTSAPVPSTHGQATAVPPPEGEHGCSGPMSYSSLQPQCHSAALRGQKERVIHSMIIANLSGRSPNSRVQQPSDQKLPSSLASRVTLSKTLNLPEPPLLCLKIGTIITTSQGCCGISDDVRQKHSVLPPGT